MANNGQILTGQNKLFHIKFMNSDDDHIIIWGNLTDNNRSSCGSYLKTDAVTHKGEVLTNVTPFILTPISL